MHYKWISIECAYNICISIIMHKPNHSAELKTENNSYCWIVELIEEKQALKMVYLLVSQK